MKKIISIVLLVLVLVVGGLILGPGFVDWNKYKPEILSQLQSVTGHEYTIAGNIELAIVPMPRVKIENLSVAMPGTLGGATIASLEKAAVYVELMPLLQKRIVVKSVELVKPVFNLGVRADGTAVWMTPELQQKVDAGKTAPAQSSGDFGNAISLNEIKITDGAFTYKDAVKGTQTSLNKIDLDIQGDSLFGPYKVSGQVNYNDQPVRLNLKSAKISDGSAAVPVQAEIQVANDATKITYSGVVVTKPALELQGETIVSSANLSDALKVMTGAANPAFAKPVNLTGILTFRNNGVDYKNMALRYGGMEATGSVTVQNLKSETGQPLDVTLMLVSTQTVTFDELMPAKSDAKKTNDLIPQTIALPMNMRVKADISIKSASYKGAAFSDIVVAATMGEKEISGSVKANAAGQGKISTTYKLAAGSVSRTNKGGIILSDLSLALDGSAQAAVPEAVVKPFLTADALKGMGTVLTTPASAAYKLAITPRMASITSANVNILDTDMAISGSWQPKKASGRDLLTVNVNAASLDADAWMKRLQPEQPAAAVPADKKLDIAAMAKKLALPMDVDGSLAFGTLTLQGQSYDKVAFKGRLISNKLTIDQAGLEATDGNSLTLAGTIGDVAALKDVDLVIQGKTPDTEKTLQAFKVDTKNFPKGIGPSEVLAEFKGQPDNLTFVANAKALKGTMEASGALDDVMTTPKVSNLTVRIKHPNYVELARIFSPNFKSSVAMNKNLDAYTSMTRQGTVYTLKDFQATIGPSTLTGNLALDTGAARPKLTASLSAGDLALSDIMGVDSKAKGTVQAVTTTNSDSARWSRTPINVAWMRLYDADVKIMAKSLTWVNWRLDNAVIEGKLDNGVLALSRLNGGMYGGTINADATIAAPAGAGAPLNVKANTKLANVSIESFVSSFSGSQLVKARGTVNLDAAIDTAGVSPAALVSGLKGKGTTIGKDLVFEGFDLARVSRTLAQPSSSLKENVVSLIDTSMAGGQTAFETLDGAFTINGGVINFSKLLLTGTTASVDTTGNVNLPLWTMDLENTITLVEPKDAPPLKTSFRGPLDNPGKTLGKSALDSYIGNQVQKYIGGAISDKLKDKGILKDVVGGTAAPQNAGDVIQNLIQQKVTPTAPAVVAPTPAPASTIITPTAPVVTPPAVAPAAVETAPLAAPVEVAPAAAPAAVTVEPVAPAAVESAPVVAPTVSPEAAPVVVPEAAAPASEATPATEDPIGNLIQDLTDQ